MIKRTGVFTLALVFTVFALSCCCLRKTAQADTATASCHAQMKADGENHCGNQSPDSNATKDCSCKDTIVPALQAFNEIPLQAFSAFASTSFSVSLYQSLPSSQSLREPVRVLENLPPIYLQNSILLI